MFPYFNTILYVHFRNSREGKSTSGMGSPCAPNPLNKSLSEVHFISFAHIDSRCIAPNGCSVHGSEAVFSPEVNVCSGGKQRHDTL